MSHDPPEYRVQEPQVVARRALALSAYCCRGYIDQGKGNADAESLRERLIQWLCRFDLMGQLGPTELEAVRALLGSLRPGLASRITWDVEGLAVLAWALGRGARPEHDGEVDPYAITDSVSLLANDADTAIATAKLRSNEELEAYRELMYAVHCRVRDFRRNGGRKDFASWIEPKWLDLLGIDTKRIMSDGDLGFGGQPISSLNADKVARYEWSITEQHRASIWLVGEERNHWETTADT